MLVERYKLFISLQLLFYTNLNSTFVVLNTASTGNSYPCATPTRSITAPNTTPHCARNIQPSPIITATLKNVSIIRLQRVNEEYKHKTRTRAQVANTRFIRCPRQRSSPPLRFLFPSSRSKAHLSLRSDFEKCIGNSSRPVTG